MFISEALTDFLEHLEVEGGRSPKTIANYQLYLERFIDFAGDITVDKITSEVMSDESINGENATDEIFTFIS